MAQFFKEFKTFILRGNVMNLAVGVIIGAAFQSIVTSLTDNIISPLIGIFTGQNFDTLEFVLFGAQFRYGAFITSVINFLIMALVLFVLVKAMNALFSLGKTEETAPEPEPTTKPCPYCFSEISLKATRCPACTSQLAPDAAEL